MQFSPDSGTDVALVTAAVVAIGLSAWLLGSGIACAVALRLRRPQLARRVARWAPPVVRRLVEAALAGSVVLSAVPAGAAPAPSPAAVVDEPVVRAPEPQPRPQVTQAPVPAPTPKPEPEPRPRTYRVERGDNLWRIARAQLVARGIHEPDDATVARYWERVIDANRSTLRSGDPSLIYPGEIIALPESG